MRDVHLPKHDGTWKRHRVSTIQLWQKPSKPFRLRTAFAAAHVIADPFGNNTPGSHAAVEWDQTLAFRQHLFGYGFGVAEAEVTVQGSGANAAIVVTVPGVNPEGITNLLKQTARLDFRAVLAAGSGIEIANPSPSPSATPDQAAVNVALSFSPYRELTRFTNSEEGWAAQCGTTVDPRMVNQYGENLLEPAPIMDGEIVKTSTGIPFAMVHQYDRIPEWNQIITKKYE